MLLKARCYCPILPGGGQEGELLFSVKSTETKHPRKETSLKAAATTGLRGARNFPLLVREGKQPESSTNPDHLMLQHQGLVEPWDMLEGHRG